MKKLKQILKQNKPLTWLFFLNLVLLIFIILLVASDSYDQGYKRMRNYYHEIPQVTLEIKEDKTAPRGIVKEYTFPIHYVQGDAVIAFYNIHNYIRVYMDDTLVYALEPTSEMKLGKTLGLSWASVPLERADSRRTCRVELRPVYDNVIDEETTFYIGPELDVFREIFLDDLPIFILAVFSVLIGILLMMISVVYKLKMKLMDVYPFYLGVFSVLIGLWKGLELEMTPIIFPFTTKTVFFISFGALTLMPAAFAMYIKELFSRYNNKVVKAFSYYITIASSVLLLLQLFGIRDLRANIYEVHFLILLVVILIIYVNFYLHKIGEKHSKVYILTLIFSFAGLVDITLYLNDIDTRSTYFSFILFLVYSVIIGIRSISENGRKAYVDITTELYNRSYCQMALSNRLITKESKAVIMMDLNFLKKTNDLFGHDEGDKLIKDFSDAIRPENTRHAIVGRYGGDEFVIILRSTSIEELEGIKERIEKRVVEKNKEDRKIELSYALGYSYDDKDEKTYEQLLVLADQEMYKNKFTMKMNALEK